MKASLYFYLNEEKTNARHSTIPIYFRVRLNRKKAEGRLYYADVLEKENHCVIFLFRLTNLIKFIADYTTRSAASLITQNMNRLIVMANKV